MIRRMLIAAAAILAFAARANAATILAVLVDPPSVAGGGATSTRSGAGTFQIFAVDDNAGTGGIATYQITMGPAVTASNNRSPVTTIMDANGDNQSAGFNLLRSGSNAAAMAGAQNLPGQTTFFVKGMGQTVGSFIKVAATQPGSTVVGPTTSGSWGGPYASLASTLPPQGPVDYVGANGAKKWLFLGEGLYNPALLVGGTPDQRLLGIASAAAITVYTSPAPNDFTQIASTTNTVISVLDPPPWPEPSTLTLLGLGLAGGFSSLRRR
jgi:hypothetical protein